MYLCDVAPGMLVNEPVRDEPLAHCQVRSAGELPSGSVSVPDIASPTVGWVVDRPTLPSFGVTAMPSTVADVTASSLLPGPCGSV